MQGGKDMLDMTVRELLSACGITTQDMDEAVDALDGQLAIFKRRVDPKRYVDGKDRVIFVAAIRGTGFWAAFSKDGDGGLEMLKLPVSGSMADAQSILDACAQKKGWAATPKPESVMEALGLVMNSAPPLETIRGWSEVEMVAAANWAVATHLRASDTHVKVPAVPNVLFNYYRGAA